VNNRVAFLVGLQWVLVAAMFLGTALVWPYAPDQIPTHWNLAGQATRYADKVQGLLLLPFLAAGLVVLLRALPRVDPKRERYAEFATEYAVVGLAVVAMLAVIQAMIVLWSFGITVDVGLVIGLSVGVLLVVVGLVLGDVPRNWFMGVRTPWTMESDRSWRLTHRQARWVFIVMGLSFALAGIAQAPWAFISAVAVCVAGVLGLVVYSYFAWRDDPNRDRPRAT
jgi:uncharacterized membrane protein